MIKYEALNSDNEKVVGSVYGPNDTKILNKLVEEGELKSVKVLDCKSESPEEYIKNLGYEMLDVDNDDGFVLYQKSFIQYTISVSSEKQAGLIYNDGRLFVFIIFNDELGNFIPVEKLNILKNASSRAIKLQDELDTLFERMETNRQ